MRKHKKLPIFKSEDEEARFWDTHSPLDFPGEFEVVKEPVQISAALLKRVAKRRQERKRALTLRMGQEQVDLTKVIAKWKGLGYQTQMRMWVIEGIHKELAAHPEMKRMFAPR